MLAGQDFVSLKLTLQDNSKPQIENRAMATMRHKVKHKNDATKSLAEYKN
ncbi:hypothetical protein AN958_11991 [Leucoagaricus sp. SymC.cos]|nr:hypothetical protein AN958_11991 [Leucoagaricus sp. SymC.cos]